MESEEKKSAQPEETAPVAHTEAPVELKSAETPAKEPTPTGSEKPNRTLVTGGIVALVVIVLAGGAFAIANHNKQSNGSNSAYGGTSPTPSSSASSGSTATLDVSSFSTDPVGIGKYLSHSNCTGEGSKLLNHPVMMPEDISIILPMGLTVGGHVTPVDHQYYYGKNQSAAKSTYNVYAPADGTLVNIEVRPKGNGGADYRGVISYSCTFFSYFDLTNSLSDAISAQMPAGWETKNGPQALNIPVKEGDVLAKIGGQSLDFAVWDTTKNLTGLLVPKAYANSEPWKIHTVHPLDYYTDALKAAVLPFYARSVEPRDGRIDYDIDGYATGTWFKKGTNGYIGAFSEATYNSQSYADGHLSIAPNLYDPTAWIFSSGAINHGTQYAIKTPTTAPDKLNQAAGMVKYTLLQLNLKDDKGQKWLGQTVPKSLTVDMSSSSQGVVLVQVMGTRELKVEVFAGKTTDQVTGFTDAALTYTRGDEAGVMAAGN